MHIKKNLPFFNVVADGVASLDLELGATFQKIILVLGGTAFSKAMITNIRCKLNGKMFYEITGSRLDLINTYKGMGVSATHLAIDFSEADAKTLGGMYSGGIGTAAGVSAFTIEVTIAGATAPTLESYSLVTAPQPLGIIMGMVSHPVTLSAAGKFPVVLPHGPEAEMLLKRVHFFNANMTHLEVKKNGLVIFDEVAVAQNTFMALDYGKVAQAGLYVYDPIVDNNVAGVVQTGNAASMRFNPTVSGADTLNIYAEVIGMLDKF